MSAERCRDLVGRCARLVRDVTAVGGWTFNKGEVVVVNHTYRGRYTLLSRRPVPEELRRQGHMRFSISQVSRAAFVIVEDEHEQEQKKGATS